MDIADYLAILRKNVVMIVGVTIVFVTIAIAVTWKIPVDYQSSCAVEVSRYQTQNQSDVSYFQYDNFYNTEVATTYANNLVGLATAPSIVAETYQRAGIAIPDVSLKDLGKTFTAKKKVDGSSVVDLTYSSKDSQKSEVMITTLSKILKEKIEDTNADDASAKFNVATSSTVVVANPKTYTLNAIIAGIFGLFLAVSYSFLRESLKK